ncbi:MAG: DUF192 domain-containing protein [Castellaniella sp.]
MSAYPKNHYPRARGRLVVAAMLAIGCLACRPAAAQDPLPTVALQIGPHALTAELADTPDRLREGLMHRTKLAKDAGMLFMLGAANHYCFWMKNTLIPLSIAFIDETGTIVSIQEMQAGSLDLHCTQEPATAALEMSQGWFEQAGIRKGNRVQGIPATPVLQDRNEP